MLQLKAIYSLRLIIRKHQNILVKNSSFFLSRRSRLSLEVEPEISSSLLFNFQKSLDLTIAPCRKRGVACGCGGGRISLVSEPTTCPVIQCISLSMGLNELWLCGWISEG